MKRLIPSVAFLLLSACAKQEVAGLKTPSSQVMQDRTTPPVIIGTDNRGLAAAGGVILHVRDGSNGPVNYKVIYRSPGTTERWRQMNAVASGGKLVLKGLLSNTTYEYKAARYVGPVTMTGYSNAIIATTN